MRHQVMLLAVIVVLLGLADVALAMGALGGEVPSSIPRPARDFTFRVTDLSGVESELRAFNIEGLVYLSGNRGRATVAIPFERIHEVLLRRGAQGLVAEVALQGGGQVTLEVDGNQKCYGKIAYGNVQIELRDLQRLVNLGPSPPQR